MCRRVLIDGMQLYTGESFSTNRLIIRNDTMSTAGVTTTKQILWDGYIPEDAIYLWTNGAWKHAELLAASYTCKSNEYEVPTTHALKCIALERPTSIVMKIVMRPSVDKELEVAPTWVKIVPRTLMLNA